MRKLLAAFCLTSLFAIAQIEAPAIAQVPQSGLVQQLLSLSAEELTAAAERSGSAARGAILFHGPVLSCGKCHSVSDAGPDLLGPSLVRPVKNQAPGHLVRSILQPSEVVESQYRTTQILTSDGDVLTGMLVKESDEGLVLRTADTLQDVEVDEGEIEDLKHSAQSLMPAGLLGALASKAEALDLFKYVLEIQNGGAARARQLQPTAAQLAIQLPEYEKNIDHAGLITSWDQDSLARGREVYMSLCINCHGTLDAPGSLASAIRFAEGKFKYGSDPHSIYQTLTRGAGLMLPQPWMVPQQKYDVIHYIRENFLRRHNSSQLFPIDDDYLSGLPEGTDQGPPPRKIEPWSQADYGPRLAGTYEIGRGGRNIAYKGIAIQLDGAPGGVAHGRAWAIFDHDTMRLAGVWSGGGFIDWQGIHFNGRHGMHPHIAGDVLLSNPTGPGWAKPGTQDTDDDSRVVGRDGKNYGPLPRGWAKFNGIYQVGQRSVIDYTVGSTSVRESYGWSDQSDQSAVGSNAVALPSTSGQVGVFTRYLTVGPRSDPLVMVVATLDDESGRWDVAASQASQRVDMQQAASAGGAHFSGLHYYQIEQVDEIDLNQAFTLRARVTIDGDGTIFARAPRSGPWAPGGQSLFVRDGRLTYDVGWVGAVQSKRRIDDGKPHDVAMIFDPRKGLISLWIDGKQAAKKKLRPSEPIEQPVFRIGYTTEDFPATSELADSSIEQVQIFDQMLQPEELSQWGNTDHLVASWDLRNMESDGSGVNPNSYALQLVRLEETVEPLQIQTASSRVATQLEAQGSQLMLQIPPGEATEIMLHAYRSIERIDSLSTDASFASTQNQILPKPPLMPEIIKTTFQTGEPIDGFATDTLTLPVANPWNAQLRLSGLDFFDDPDRMAVCTWDGDVWTVSGLAALDSGLATVELQWRRIAQGLFQPLGIKIIDGTIYLTCRDQLVRLEDRNGDGETDYYHCVNNDHQVTEHFHEFAMGLQTDEAGNFYYAKSARHALTALVPHHGTLLRVSADGEQTDILATGFRAANGVCLNPDGSFIVTDQEGHWNPKNRINWVSEGGFYGNMYGYHDVTDQSDTAMAQPLCWITNAFDRSPAELLWVDEDCWGPFSGKLLNLSYGYGKVFIVPHETIDQQPQGGMCALPIAQFPTGVMRGRFSPFDKQLYACGLSAWGSNQTSQVGGLYRVRYTGAAAALPLDLRARKGRIEIRFSDPLHRSTSLKPDNYEVRVWSLKRTKNYGSKHYDEHPLKIVSVQLSEDRQLLTLMLDEVQPTWCMEIRLPVVTEDGNHVERVLHNTIHQVGLE